MAIDEQDYEFDENDFGEPKPEPVIKYEEGFDPNEYDLNDFESVEQVTPVVYEEGLDPGEYDLNDFESPKSMPVTAAEIFPENKQQIIDEEPSRNSDLEILQRYESGTKFDVGM